MSQIIPEVGDIWQHGGNTYVVFEQISNHTTKVLFFAKTYRFFNEDTKSLTGFGKYLGTTSVNIADLFKIQKSSVAEICPMCEHEVILSNAIIKQPIKCPKCNKYIMPCNLCDKCNNNCGAEYLNHKTGKINNE